LKLVDCLAAQTWRALQAISRGNGLGFDANLTKRQAVERLAAWLGGDEHLGSVDSLPAEARAALRELLATGGQMAHEAFTRRFGPVRPYRPWRPEAARSPWTDPQSASERLVYRGLVFPVTVGPARHRRRVIALPDEFYDPLAARLSAALPAGLDAPRSPPTPSLPLDLLTFLGFLQRQDVRPIWGRWLPPTALRALNRLLILPDDLDGVRSERQARRIPFLHYLAEAAGLAGLAAAHLKPTLEAHPWLGKPARDRIAILWRAWQESSEDNDARWTAYRLPGWSAPAPVDRFRRLGRALASFLPGHALPASDWPAALGRVDPALLRPTPVYDEWARLSAGSQAEWTEGLEAALGELVTGPLTWFGVFAPLDGGESLTEPRSAPAKDARETALAFTPLGAVLAGRNDGAWPADPPPERLRIAPRPEKVDGVLTILCLAPPGLPWQERLSLEALAAPQPGAPGRYRLTRAGLLRALHGGYTVEGAAALLEALSGEPLPLPVFAALGEWDAAYGQVTLRPVTLLQVRDPALLQQLASVRRLRAFFGETFSERAVGVDSSRLPQLLHALERRGLMPRVEARLDGVTTRSKKEDVTPTERALIVAALELYAALAESMPEAPPPPHALVQQWGQRLTPAERHAANRAVQTVMGQLRRAGRPAVGRPHLPTPTGPLLERLEAAIAAGEAVTITYYTASRDHIDTRRITPLRLEWRGETAYCVAHCHLRGAERVFRVDRMVEMA
jgi:hypothetical protein